MKTCACGCGRPVTPGSRYVVGHNPHPRKTHCKRGHPFDEGNTRVWRGKRSCRACQAKRDSEKYKARRAAIVDFDSHTGCYRIYIRQGVPGAEEDDPQNGITWWPLEWMRFATREVAERHLELHDWPAYGVAA